MLSSTRQRDWRGVRFSEEFVDGTIPRERVQRIVLRKGLQTPQPLLTTIIGMILVCAALGIPAYYYFQMMQNGTFLIAFPAFFLIVGIVGAYLIFVGLLRGYFLEVSFDGGTRKLAFRNKPRVEDVESFLKTVEESFGYVTERSLPTGGFPVDGSTP